MTINPDDPWYPIEIYDAQSDKPGVTIRLKLAAMAMQGLLSGVGREEYEDDGVAAIHVRECAFTIADAMIDRANRDEGTAG